MIVSKGIKLLAQTAVFKYDIRECQWQPSDFKAWEAFNILFHHSYREQQHVVKTKDKGGYTSEVQNIYDVPLPAQLD